MEPLPAIPQQRKTKRLLKTNRLRPPATMVRLRHKRAVALPLLRLLLPVRAPLRPLRQEQLPSLSSKIHISCAVPKICGTAQRMYPQHPLTEYLNA